MKVGVFVATFGSTLMLASGGLTFTSPHLAALKAPPKWEEVSTIFKTSCMPCHSDKNHRAGVDLTSYEAVMKGGEEGPVIVPKNVKKSKLIDYVTGAKPPMMPPKSKAPLTEDQIKTLKNWINAGALGPDGQKPPKG